MGWCAESEAELAFWATVGVSAKRCAWHKANNDNVDTYKYNLDVLLGEIHIPNDTIFCKNILYNNIIYSSTIHIFMQVHDIHLVTVAEYIIFKHSTSFELIPQSTDINRQSH